MNIRIQADDFFNAYRVLEQSNEVAIEKLQESSGETLVSEKAFGVVPTFSPAIVCLAFSVELYIKDIYCVLKLKVPHGKNGHNVLKLFDKLPEPVKKDLFYHKTISQNPFLTRGNILYTNRFSKNYSPYDGFRDQMKEISDSFVKWRYSYESRSLNYDLSFALALIEALKFVSDRVRTA